jgi:NADH dehydrogenase [ubiquinone] 1 alpha subcomplex assembly factor 1
MELIVRLFFVLMGGLITMTVPAPQRLVTFDGTTDAAWFIVNDTVMGGISDSTLTRQSPTVARFSGVVSLENNGGFASVRARLQPIDLSACDAIQLRVRGDGQRYGFNLRSVGFSRLSYRVTFETTADEWQTVTLPFATFQPTSFGQVVANAPALDLTEVSEMGFIITDKQDGAFALDIAWIDAVCTEPTV